MSYYKKYKKKGKSAASNPHLKFAKNSDDIYEDTYKAEADFQKLCEEELELHRFVRPGDITSCRRDIGALIGVYFHIPNQAFSHGKTIVGSYLKNLPDLIVLHGNGTYWAPELKAEQGVKSSGQKAVAKLIKTSEFRSIEHFTKELHKWLQ